MSVAKLSPWVSQPLTETAKEEQFKQRMNVHAERAILGKQAIIYGWTMGAVGIACLGISAFGWIKVMSRPLAPPQFIIIDSWHGDVGRPISIEDAPKSFGPATEQFFVRQFLLAYEQWTPERDSENDTIVRNMSTKEEQTRLNAVRATPEWKKDRDKDTHINISNFRYFSQPLDAKTNTHQYRVLFDRQVVRSGTTGPKEPWTAFIDFQWHPDANMTPAVREMNFAGFVETNYNSSSDLVIRKQP
jgi:hypothetical protein